MYIVSCISSLRSTYNSVHCFILDPPPDLGPYQPLLFPILQTYGIRRIRCSLLFFQQNDSGPKSCQDSRAGRRPYEESSWTVPYVILLETPFYDGLQYSIELVLLFSLYHGYSESERPCSKPLFRTRIDWRLSMVTVRTTSGTHTVSEVSGCLSP